MKLSELRACDGCGGPIAPTFHVVRVSLAFFDPRALQQVRGLGDILGGIQRPGVLHVAEALAPEADVVKVAGDEKRELQTELLLCMGCSIERLGSPLEKVAEAEKKKSAAADRVESPA